jgi:hypothetical protein
VHPAGDDHRRRLHDCWANFAGNCRVAQPKAAHRERFEDNVERLMDIGPSLMAAKLTRVPLGESVAASTPIAGPLTPSSARRSFA